MKPSLTAALRRAGVPGNGEGLIAAAGKRDEILLQGLDTKSVGDRIVVESTIGAFGAHHEFSVALEEGRGDAVVLEGGIGEITEHAAIVRRLHREVVMRSPPGTRLHSVTALACFCPDILGRLAGHAGSERERRTQGQEDCGP